MQAHIIGFTFFVLQLILGSLFVFVGYTFGKLSVQKNPETKPEPQAEVKSSPKTNARPIRI